MEFSCRLLDLSSSRIVGLAGLVGARIETKRHGKTDQSHAGLAVGLTDFRAFYWAKPQLDQLAMWLSGAVGPISFGNVNSMAPHWPASIGAVGPISFGNVNAFASCGYQARLVQFRLATSTGDIAALLASQDTVDPISPDSREMS